ncbi:hypothetical protein ACFL4G_06730 [Thermodesulfobacteriota bacterium]
MDFFDLLKYGIIGLGTILAVLSYQLLSREQRQSNPRPTILKAVYIFMGFSLLLCVLGILAQGLQTLQPLQSSGRNGTNPPLSDAAIWRENLITLDSFPDTPTYELSGRIYTNRVGFLAALRSLELEGYDKLDQMRDHIEEAVLLAPSVTLSDNDVNDIELTPYIQHSFERFSRMIKEQAYSYDENKE